MQLDSTIVAGGLGALATMAAAIYALHGGRRRDRVRAIEESDLRRFEQTHERKLQLYGQAFRITEKLSSNYIVTKGAVVEASLFEGVKHELIAWSLDCGPIMHDETLKAFRALLASLSEPAKADGTMSRRVRNQVWRNRTWLRGCIKNELKCVVPS